MKKILLLLSFLCVGFFLHAQIFITEIADPNDNASCRYVELYNAGASSVDLAAGNYALQRYTNDNNSPQTPVALTGIIPAMGFYIIANNASSFQTCYSSMPNQAIGNGGPADSNGDDQISLVIDNSGTITVIDFFGVIGEDGTGTCHEFEDGRAERVATVTMPSATWVQSEWNVFADNERLDPNDNSVCVVNDPQNAADGDFDPGMWIGATVSNDPMVAFTSSTYEVNETDGTVDATVCVSITNENANATMVNVALRSSVSSNSATNGVDIATYSTQTLTFPASTNTEQCISFTLIDDTDFEGTEELSFELESPTNGAMLGSPSVTVVDIIDDDSPIVINEVLADPPSDISGDANGDGTRDGGEDEFIEIINISASPLDMSDWTISDDFGLRHTFPSGTIVPAGVAITVFGGGTPTGIAGVVQTASTGFLGLSNSGDDITIRTAPSGGVFRLSGELIAATFSYGSEGGQDQSLARSPNQTGPFVQHTTILNNPVNFSPGQNNDDGLLLPVELSSFTGKRTTQSIQLNWTTASESNNSHFEIERSHNSKTFQAIGKVMGAGNSLAQSAYTFADQQPLKGMNYYRLRQVDFDGKYEYSEVVVVNMEVEKEISIAPTLAHNILNVSVLGRANLVIMNTVGARVKEWAIADSQTVDISDLVAGTYFLLAEIEGRVEVLRFVKQ
ncbi:MAG: lamin tail domain-containing protein [Bacteroidota bacterium]